MGAWEDACHIENLLDLLMTAKQALSSPINTTTTTTSTSMPSSMPFDHASNKKQKKRPAKDQHPQWINPETRTCINARCTNARALDFIVDANGGSVVCIQCGTIQTTGVLENAVPINADSTTRANATSSVTVVHRYSRIAYVRGLLTSIDGSTNVALTDEETAAIQHYTTAHRHDEDEDIDAHAVKRAIKKMSLRPCLCYHAHTIAFRLFRTTTPPPSNDDIRQILTRFRSLENEWDRSPRNGTLRNGAKKFPSIPWVWQRICLDLGPSKLENVELMCSLFRVPTPQKKCLVKRFRQYTQLKRLADRHLAPPHPLPPSPLCCETAQ